MVGTTDGPVIFPTNTQMFGGKKPISLCPVMVTVFSDQSEAEASALTMSHHTSLLSESLDEGPGRLSLTTGFCGIQQAVQPAQAAGMMEDSAREKVET